jgi:hypothetical protein
MSEKDEDLPEHNIREFLKDYEEAQGLEKELRDVIRQIQRKYRHLSRQLDKEIALLKRSIKDPNRLHYLAQYYSELNIRHPNIIYGIGLTFMLLGTISSVFVIIAAGGGLAGAFGLAGGFSALSFIGSGGFGLLSGTMYSFLVDIGPKIATRLADVD